MMIKNGRTIGNVIRDRACVISQNLQTFSLFFNFSISALSAKVVISLLLGIIRKVNSHVTNGNAIIYTNLKGK